MVLEVVAPVVKYLESAETCNYVESIQSSLVVTESIVLRKISVLIHFSYDKLLGSRNKDKVTVSTGNYRLVDRNKSQRHHQSAGIAELLQLMFCNLIDD